MREAQRLRRAWDAPSDALSTSQEAVHGSWYLSAPALAATLMEGNASDVVIAGMDLSGTPFTFLRA